MNTLTRKRYCRLKNGKFVDKFLNDYTTKNNLLLTRDGMGQFSTIVGGIEKQGNEVFDLIIPGDLVIYYSTEDHRVKSEVMPYPDKPDHNMIWDDVRNGVIQQILIKIEHGYRTAAASEYREWRFF